MSAQSSTRTRGTRAARRQRTQKTPTTKLICLILRVSNSGKIEGGLDAAQRANRRWKQLLQDYQAPALDDSIDEALLAFIAQRKESMPDAWY